MRRTWTAPWWLFPLRHAGDCYRHLTIHGVLLGLLLTPVTSVIGPFLIDLAVYGRVVAVEKLLALTFGDHAVALVLTVAYTTGFFVIRHWLRHWHVVTCAACHVVTCADCSPVDAFGDDDLEVQR